MDLRQHHSVEGLGSDEANINRVVVERSMDCRSTPVHVGLSEPSEQRG